MRTELVALAVALAGCSTLCKGPSCADTYGNGRLSLLSWSDALPRRLDPWEDATYRLDGQEDHGTDWTVLVAGPGEVWLGLPDADQVMRLRVDGGRRLRPDLTITGTGSFGAAMARYDIDGDGVRELLVGAPEVDLAMGAVYAFSDLGVTTGALTADQADAVFRGTSPSDRFGTAIVPCADLTGDDRPELAITAPWLESARGNTIPPLAGGVFLVTSDALNQPSGDLDPWELGPVWWGPTEGSDLGRDLTCRHDLNGDRRADIAIGAPYEGNGRVYIIEPDALAALAGEPSLPDFGPLDTTVAGIRAIGTETADAWFGASLATAELDGEAPFDLIVGAPGALAGTGRVDVFRGPDLQLLLPPPWRVVRNQASRTEPDHFGRRVVTRDLDGDDVEDLLVGAPDWYDGGNAFDAGRVFIWSGAVADVWPSTFTVESADWTVEGTEPFQRVGRRIEVFDVDGDGNRELALPTRAIPPP